MRTFVLVASMTAAISSIAPTVRAQTLADRIKSGYLLRHGITAGLALAIHTPPANSRDNELAQFATSAMPYVLLSPLYWALGDVSQVYCSSDWIFASRTDAASATAVQMTKDRWAPDMLPSDNEEYKKLYSDRVNKPLPSSDAELDQWIGLRERADDENRKLTDAEKTQVETAEALVYAITEWRMHVPGAYCIPAAALNVWAGIPLKFSADLTEKSTTLGYDIIPRVAFGWGILISPFIHFLAGVSYSEFKVKDAQYHGVWAPLIGIGGNIDVIALVVK